jgi:AbrB family looped-hinge helix DNA binding protein
MAGRPARYVLKLDEKGRVTIPQVVRDALGLEPGMFIELVVEKDSKTIVLRPAASGVMATYRVSLDKRSDVVGLVSSVVEEGSDLRYLECGETECFLSVFLIDTVMAEKLAEKLRGMGIQVIEYSVR